MRKIPIDESDLLEVAIYFDMLQKKPVDHIIPSDVHTTCLRYIFENETNEAIKEYDRNCFKKNWEKDF